MRILVIDYNAGNVQSVLFALKRLGHSAELSNDTSKIQAADKIIFPGVGEASSTMRFLRNKGLASLIPGIKQPFLGICLGLQILCKHSEENNTPCMGVFDEQIKKFTNTSESHLKIPHMGWNSISGLKGKIFQDVPENSQVYFVHSYYATIGADTSAVCEYANNFSAALEKDNFFAVQFHPEKSADVGESILKNFLDI